MRILPAKQSLFPSRLYGYSLMGFTLIETLVYIGLLSIIIGGVLVSTYQLIEGTERTNKKVTTQEEANFLLRKIDWALTGITSIANPTPGARYGRILSVNKINYAQNPITIQFHVASSSAEIQEGASPFLPITSDNVTVSDLNFQYIPADGTAPAGIKATTTINGLYFETTKYIRK